MKEIALGVENNKPLNFTRDSFKANKISLDKIIVALFVRLFIDLFLIDKEWKCHFQETCFI